MNKITKIFLDFDKTMRERDELAEAAKDETKLCGMHKHTDHDPEGKPYTTITTGSFSYHVMDDKDHNGYAVHFLFATTNKYRHTSHEYRDVILANSELKKVLYKDDEIEMGISIDQGLRYPTENIWGYSFSGWKYYVIKDNKRLTTERRSEIRKVFNGVSSIDDISNTYVTSNNIRIDYGFETKTFELEDFTEIYESKEKYYNNKIYELEFNDETYYAARDDSDLFSYSLECLDDDDIISRIGQKEINEMFLAGRSFDRQNYFLMDSIHDFICIEEIPTEVPTIELCTIDDLEGYKIFKQL